MKINEVLQPSGNSLYEAIDRNNTTGFLTEDLVSVINNRNTALTESNLEDLLDHIDQVVNG